MGRLKPDYVEAKASEFRSVNGLSETQPIEFKSLLLKLNVLTLFRPLSSDFSGMCLRDRSNNRFMLINSNDIIARQHFTMAHELFHLFEEDDFEPHVCNPGSGSRTTPSERNADAFATALLMPRTGLWTFIPEEELNNKSVSISTILKIEHYYSVSRITLLHRLENMGAIGTVNKAKLESYPRMATALQYGYETFLYRAGNEDLVIGDYVEKARRLFEEERISEGHYLELLNKIHKDGITESEED